MANVMNETSYGATKLSCTGGTHHHACDCREAKFRELREAGDDLLRVYLLSPSPTAIRFRAALEETKP